VKDPEARAFLGMLLEKLEGMKNDMSANEAVQDIIEHEIQSAAYLETFALKVFNLADNIDRSGKATR
jgi:vacuolar protein sorting-associated protein VTA1